jgi:hypothetical protein
MRQVKLPEYLSNDKCSFPHEELKRFLIAFAKMYPKGIVYRAKVALKKAIAGSIASKASAGILNPTGGG